ncbi:hypothetical protein Z517_02259 [Fonsecaea pedrosoi CBS 271.37]|uniref:Thioesterase domain-containing protein n=1 Tax=Fonsecaea pedrosoi CBS 271.37 TaxID=1442368 RepID=A0A0D2DZ47_9EURO|nr:uncharacterized protein Z517_02259 [Fonsecaea pedrosoi CBS 271.37]KIW83016.1 hypothetical protein Z517_02259 [Fonsecaea pedrosoi CBS 271.37]
MGSTDTRRGGAEPPMPQSTLLDHFRSIPWCVPHLSDPAFRQVNMSRTLMQPGNGHSLMAETWNTDKTITHLLSLYRPPIHNGDTTDTHRGTGIGMDSQTRGEVRRFYTFGTGMNAHPNTLHGGVVATVLDSTMGNVIGHQMPDRLATFTVALNVTYKKPVGTPGTIMARSWITRAEGRKIWVHGVIEDGQGNVHAEAEGMWLRAKPKL